MVSNDTDRSFEEAAASRRSGGRNASGRARALWFLLLLVVVLKLTYFFQYAQLPFLEAPLFDSSVYLQQAEAIRSGKFGDPTLIAFSPLYGYFLAVAGSFAVAVQLALGLLNLVLLYRLTAALFERIAAVAAAALYFGYGLLLFYESKVLSETLGLTLALGAMALYLSVGFGSARPWAALACGGLLGLAVLARANLVFSTPFFAAASLLPWRYADERDSPASPRAQGWRALLFGSGWRALLFGSGWRAWLFGPGSRAFWQRVRRTALLVCGLVLVLAANGLWNYANTGLFVPLTLVSRAISVGTARPWEGSLSAHTVGSGAVSPWDVVDRARERLANPEAEQPPPSIDLLGWLSGSPSKLLAGLSDKEISFQYGYYGERSEVPVLNVMPVTFHGIGILSILGMLGLVRRSGMRALLPYLPYVLGAIATITLYHPSSRYRVVMVLPMLVLAGHGLAVLVSARKGKMRHLLVAAMVAACAVLSYRTMAYELAYPGMWHLRVAEAEAMRGDLEATGLRIQKALEAEPASAEVRMRIKYIIGITRGRLVPPEP